MVKLLNIATTVLIALTVKLLNIATIVVMAT
jgi:hypothetical protein